MDEVDLNLLGALDALLTGFSHAMRIARRSDLVALVPGSCLGDADAVPEGLQAFPLPVRTPDIAITAMWHPRMDADPGHRWLRETVVATCRPGGCRHP